MKYSKGETSWSSFPSLPNEIVLSCLALIPKSYYPKLFLVSKSFQSLLTSKDLVRERIYLKTQENCVFLCLKLTTRYHPFWFSLYKTKNTGYLLVPFPSSYTPYLEIWYEPIGSESYTLDGGISTPSSVLKITNELKHGDWRMTPSMKVARMDTLLTTVLDEKLYVIGGCDPSESTHWAEVFDVKTQTWESLPDPGHELRNSTLKKNHTWEGKLWVITSDKNHYVYDPKQGRWDVTETHMSDSICQIDNVVYTFHDKECFWCDSKLKEWNEVNVSLTL